MFEITTAYGIFLIISMVLSIFLLFRSMSKQGAEYTLLSAIAVLMVFLFAGEASEIFFAQRGLHLAIAFGNIGYSLLPVVCLLFALFYISREKYLKWKYIILISIIPIIFVIVGFINPFTGIIGQIILNSDGSITYHWNMFYYVLCAYELLISLFALIFLIFALISKKYPNKKQLSILGLAIICPTISGLLNMLAVFPVIDINPLGYFFSLILLEFAVYNYGMLDYAILQQEFIEHVEAGMLFFNAGDHLIEFNKSSETLFGLNNNSYNLKIDDLELPNEFLEFYNGSDDFKVIQIPNKNFSEENLVESSEVSHDSSQYPVLSFDFYKKPYYDNKRFVGYLITFYDVTDHVEYEKRLIQSDQDKTVLIKEVHHRVKNNLQLVNSFINLEERFHKDNPEEIINLTKKRLASLSLIHERIYAEDDLSTISVKSFLDDFDRSLFALSSSTDIEFINDADEKISLAIDIMTPLTLLINELTTNSFKYAWDEGSIGNKIFKSIEIIEENGSKFCKFIYKDNGKGLPEDFNIDTLRTLGMTIIKSLSGQLDGEFEMFNDNGFNFVLKFPLN